MYKTSDLKDFILLRLYPLWLALFSLLWAVPALGQSPPEKNLRILPWAKLPRPRKLPLRLVRKPKAVHKKTAPAPKPPRKVGWGANESMTYQVKIAGVIAGRAAIAVGKPGLVRGRRVLKVRGLGETSRFLSAIYAVREELLTSIDLAGLSPIQSSQDLQDGKKSRHIDVTFGPLVVQKINRQGHRSQRHRAHPPPPLLIR